MTESYEPHDAFIAAIERAVKNEDKRGALALMHFASICKFASKHVEIAKAICDADALVSNGEGQFMSSSPCCKALDNLANLQANNGYAEWWPS